MSIEPSVCIVEVSVCMYVQAVTGGGVYVHVYAGVYVVACMFTGANGAAGNALEPPERPRKRSRARAPVLHERRLSHERSTPLLSSLALDSVQDASSGQ